MRRFESYHPSHFFTMTSIQQAQRIVLYGLGNFGSQYEQTRHNVGHWVVDGLADELNATWAKSKMAPVQMAETLVGDIRIMMIKSLGYMNLSGRAIGPIMRFYQLNIEDLWVLHDELDFLPGVVKYKHKGGAGGHNGLKDIIQHCGNAFHRFRIGIGRPVYGEVSAFVLGKPSPEDRDAITCGCRRLITILPDLLTSEHKERLITKLHEQNGGTHGA
ncbi:MAG: aminoacyl-tRNA hydrolase [Candidatus Comchoanobacterales bacterium]